MGWHLNQKVVYKLMAGTVYQRNQNPVTAGGCIPLAAGQFAWQARCTESGLGRLDGLKCEMSMNCDNSIIRMRLPGRTECSCQLITAPSAPDRVRCSVPQLCVDIQSFTKRFFVHRSWLGYSSLGIFSFWT